MVETKMSERVFKPSSSMYVLGIVIVWLIAIVLGVVWAIFVEEARYVGIIIAFMIAFLGSIGNIIGIITMQFYTFTIRENEIEIKYEFISKSKRVFRMDQMTGVKLNRGILQKMIGLGTVEFGLFGKSGVVATNYQNRSVGGAAAGPAMLGTNLFMLKEYDEVFRILSERLNLKENSKKVLVVRPSIKPIVFRLVKNVVINFLILIGLYFGYTYLRNFTSSSDLVFLYYLGIAFIFIFVVFPILFSIVNIFKFRKMKYRILEDRVEVEHNYLFSYECSRIPLKKVTNSEYSMNAINHALFGVGRVMVYTGGSNDFMAYSLKNYKKFHYVLQKRLDIVSGKVSHSHAGSLHADVDIVMEKPQHISRPGSSFVISYLWGKMISSVIFTSVIYFAISRFLGAYEYLAFLTLIPFFIGLLGRLLLWKNTKFEFYADRVVDTSGVLNVRTKVIYFKNIKYISLSRRFLFDRILGQGTVALYTAGTGGVDNYLECLKEYKTVYSTFKEVLLEHVEERKKK